MSPDLWLVREEWRQFARFLAERGGGVHHIAVVTPDFRRTLQEHRARGNEPILSGTFSGVEVDFLKTERELGVILEVFSDMPTKQGAQSARP
jgi:methylmalonyl-CoA/ethylmalonyl-CoA epimerase